MALCPNGHDSAAGDFCDICGMRIGGSAGAGQVSAAAGSASPAAGPGPAATGPAKPAEPCPNCGTGRSGQFCEACGYDFTAGASVAAGSAAGLPAPAPGRTGPAAGIWSVVVTADRAYFDSVVASGGPDAASIEFPAYCPVRRFRLSGGEMRIGRRSVSRGLEPEIDLTGPPTDTGISHLHAVLTAESDGSWSLLDPGSANGTQVNGQEVAAGVRVPVRDGDRICVGGWTLLTVEAG
ncbi:MAG TPA: FHA domain-containing protein [Streptosporangiaceae bacterium]|jgi:hypothetical protein